MYELRPYQSEAEEAVLKEWESGHKKTLMVLPTGTGKTISFAAVVADRVKKGDRVLILAHRGELLEQAADKLQQAVGIDSALEKAQSSALGSDCPVTVGSVQSMSQDQRLDQFPPDYYQDIIVDEAHHCMSDSYQKVLNHFPDANVLGVTATPDRGDQKSLSKYFDSKAYEYTMPEAIKEGYLCPIKAQIIPLRLDIGSVHMSNGDYAVGEIGNALDPYLEQIAREIMHYAYNRKTVVFLPLIATSQRFCKMLNSLGMPAAEVNGESTDRAEVLSDFAAGKYKVLCNSMLLTEGWDCPSVDCVVVLRPTKVRSLYQQMVGRGMRLNPGKKNLLLLDFLWLTGKHDLCKPSSLISRDEDIAKRINKKIEQSAGGIDLTEAQKAAEHDAMTEREASLAKQLAAERKRKRKLVDPIQYAMSIEADDLAGYEPTFAWETMPPTKEQVEYLKRKDIYTEDIKYAGMADLLIKRLRDRQRAGLATPKQIRCLEHIGFVHVGMWQFKEASNMIGWIASHNWRPPFNINPHRYKPESLRK